MTADAFSLKGSRTATAYWTTAPGTGELRTEDLPAPAADEVVVRALHSGISRGTELLVHRGLVPPALYPTMRAPFQDGDFPAPVKYGYLSVGIVETGPEELMGQTVFALHPHQDRYVVPARSVTPVPDDVPPVRAVLAGTVETAVNAVWDAGPRLGDRVAVIGAGMVGCAVAAVLRGFPLDRLELVDVDQSRACVAQQLGVPFATPEAAGTDCDLVVHCSATSAGLNRGLELLGDEGELIELSWYGDREVAVNLGADFHVRRLCVRSSQVGAIAAARRARRTHADRMALALRLLADPAFDALISSRSAFADLPRTLRRLDSGEVTGMCHVVDYEQHAGPVQRT